MVAREKCTMERKQEPVVQMDLIVPANRNEFVGDEKKSE